MVLIDTSRGLRQQIYFAVMFLNNLEILFFSFCSNDIVALRKLLLIPLDRFPVAFADPLVFFSYNSECRLNYARTNSLEVLTVVEDVVSPCQVLGVSICD